MVPGETAEGVGLGPVGVGVGPAGVGVGGNNTVCLVGVERLLGPGSGEENNWTGSELGVTMVNSTGSGLTFVLSAATEIHLGLEGAGS